MAFGARGSARDFGMKGGLALPVIERENYAKTGQLMPDEKKGRKKHFSVEQEGDGTRRKRQSIAERVRNWFKKKPDPPPDYERSTLPRRPNSAQLAPIKEQVEDEEERGKVVPDGEIENIPPSQPETAGGSDTTDNEVVVRKKKRAQDRSKAYSTAFEHTSPTTTQANPIIEKVHLTVQNPDAGPRKVVLQRRPDNESFGFHLSGGQPPITITYVKPKSVADKRGVKVGDIVLDLNGINCRKRVEISQLMKMKFMFQQPRRSSIDEQSEPVVKTKVSVTNVRKRNSQEIGDPLATSSPIKSTETSEHKERGNGNKKKGKKKKSMEKQEEADKSCSEESVPSPSAEPEPISVSVDKKTKSKKKKTKEEVPSLSSVTEDSPKADATRDKTKGEKKKKKRLSANVSENEDNGANGNGQSLEPIILSVDVEPTPMESVLAEDAGEDALEQSEQSTMQEEKLNLQKMDRSRRSTSPKSRYNMGASVAAEDEVDGEILTPQKKKTKKAASSASEADGAKKAKKKKKKADISAAEGGEENGQKEQTDGKKKKKKSTPSKKANKKATSKAETKKEAEMPILSAAVSGSFESDTMEFVPKNKESKHETVDKEEEDDTSKDLPKKSKKKKNKKGEDLDDHEWTQSLKRDKKKKSVSQSQSGSNIRRGSVDQGLLKHSMSSSQSFSSVEEQKKFREELKEASKSEHNLDELVGSLDSNLKVKKSGLVKGKSTSSSRPSIFNQSSSPEPEMTSQNSLNTSEREFQQDEEDGIPDPDFKLKKSGLVVGRKTSAGGPRPSILDEQSNAAYSDVHPGEMQYNKDIEVDLNSLPQVAPSLGLIAGRDRRDANNRSLTKRRPPSIRQTSQEETETSTASRMAAAKKLFENKADHDSTSRFNGRPLSKSVEKPPKALGVPSESTMAAKVQDKPAPQPVNSWANKAPSADTAKEGPVPSWVSKAQGVQKRTSMLETTPPPHKTTPQASKTTSPTVSPSKNGIPSTGHVAARLAMFQ